MMSVVLLTVKFPILVIDVVFSVSETSVTFEFSVFSDPKKPTKQLKQRIRRVC